MSLSLQTLVKLIKIVGIKYIHVLRSIAFTMGQIFCVDRPRNLGGTGQHIDVGFQYLIGSRGERLCSAVSVSD
jgi:hypothetical protein